jgi:hypothetical protein
MTATAEARDVGRIVVLRIAVAMMPVDRRHKMASFA